MHTNVQWHPTNASSTASGSLAFRPGITGLTNFSVVRHLPPRQVTAAESGSVYAPTELSKLP